MPVPMSSDMPSAIQYAPEAYSTQLRRNADKFHRDVRTEAVTDAIESSHGVPIPWTPLRQGQGLGIAQPVPVAGCGFHVTPNPARKRRRVGKGTAAHTTRTQSILFSKRDFTPAQAVRWLGSHGYHSAAMDAPRDYWRFRQSAPVRGAKFRTKKIAPGIEIVVEYIGE